MASHRFLAVDLVTGVVRDELPLTTVTIGETLNRAHPFSATIDVSAPKATRANIDPSRTLILVERDGIIIGDGIVWNPRVSRRGDSRQLEINGASLWSYLHRRRIRESRAYSGVDDATIIADLVAWSQGEGSTSYGPSAGDATGNVRIDTSSVTPTGVTSSRSYNGDERKLIGQAVEEFAGTINAPDFGLIWRWDTAGDGTDVPVAGLNVWARRGVRLADGFELGGNVIDYEIAIAGSEQATHVDAIGQGEGVAMKASSAVDPSLWPVYPRLDAALTLKDISVEATLTGHAQAELQARRLPPAVIRVNLDPDRTPTFGSWSVGDEAPIRIDDGWAQVDEVRRIVGWSMQIDADGAEKLSVDFAIIGDLT